MIIHSSFHSYDQEYGGEREQYPFMLSGKYPLGSLEHPEGRCCSLIFGNEARGLDICYFNVGKSVVIPHTHSIDSLNLALAVGMGIYEFCKNKNGKT